MKPIIITLLCFLIILGLSCKPLPESPDTIVNPYDTSHPNYVAPSTSITFGPSSGQTMKAPSVTFQWSGSKDVGSYSYRFDSDIWSAWTTQTSATFGNLDEESHTFAVRSRHKNGVNVEQNPQTVVFDVNAVQGQSAMFLPRIKKVSAGQPFTYDIKAEEVAGLFALRLAVFYNKYIVAVDSVQTGNLIGTNGGSEIMFFTTDSANGKATIDLVIVGGYPRGISGTGILFTLLCRPLTTGTVDFTFDPANAVYRDTLNRPITIRSLVNGKAVIQ